MEDNMAIKVIPAPGNDLESFLKTISYDLTKRKIEYLIIGFFDKNVIPIGMMEIKGKSSWVDFDLREIMDISKLYNVSSICFLHNHPIEKNEAANLLPSKEDYISLKGFIEKNIDNNLLFLGSWITSGGKFNEILNYYLERNIQDKYEIIFSDHEIAKYLTFQLKDTYTKLTKTPLLYTSWFELFTEYFGDNKYVFNVIRNRYFEQNITEYSLRLDIENEEDDSIIGNLSIEESLRALEALQSLINLSLNIEFEEKEYVELKMELSNTISCGFYGNSNLHKAFLKINGYTEFVNISDIQILIKFINKGIEKIESLIDREKEI